MKKYVFFFLFILAGLGMKAQVFKASEADKISQGADLVWLKPYTQVPVFIRFRNSMQLDYEKSLSYMRQFFSNQEIGLELKSVQNNRDNEYTYRYMQTFRGYPIEFAMWNIQVQGNRVFAMNGELLDNPQVDVRYVIGEENALQAALDYVDAQVYMWEDEVQESMYKEFMNDTSATYYPIAERVIVPDHIVLDGSELRTAYKFNIYSYQPFQRGNVYVDAITGTVLAYLPLMYNIDTVGIAHTQYSGIRNINTETCTEGFRLRDNTRGNGIRTLDCNMGTSYGNAEDFIDSDNEWNNINSNLDQYATDAHFAAMSTYDYFLQVHNRNSIDGNGYRLWSYVHYDLTNAGYTNNINAFWDGQRMTYGDGSASQGITPLTTIDISAHEITHGLTSYTAALNYINESGALNEAFSDIFGCSVEYFVDSIHSNWTIGEDIGYTMRSIANPNQYGLPDTYHGNYWTFGSSDQGGVHTNMGPMCYMFYLLCQGGSGTNDLGNNYSVEAIGRVKAEQIIFRLQTVYLTPNSDYESAFFAALQAASDLYGACSDEVEAVGNAFYAIGVTNLFQNHAFADFRVNETESCEAPFEVQFTNLSYNGDSFLWNFGDGTTSTLVNPSHTYNQFGTFDVRLIVNSQMCGSDTMTITQLITIDESFTCTYKMPSTGFLLIEECSGIIYDSGGPNENYYDNSDGRITIHAPNADHIVLVFNDFDIEAGSNTECDYDYMAFYDGSNQNAPLINGTYYCNTTGVPPSITSSGEYLTIKFYSDGGLTLRGFAILFECIGANMPPTPYFEANVTTSCDGKISFNDLSFNNPTFWLWNFGDGNTSTLQHPEHHYFHSGNYSVTLTTTNSNGTTYRTIPDYITVQLPEIDTLAICEEDFSQSFTVNLNVDGEAQWYISEGDPTPDYVGNSRDFAPMDVSVAPLIYNIRTLHEGEEFDIGETQANQGGGFFGNSDYIHYLVFDAYTPFRIESVVVNAQGAGERHIALRNAQQEVLVTKTVYCPNGVSRINLDIDIPEGVDLQLVGLGSPDLYRTNLGSYLNYPYQIENVASIKHSSASETPNDYYYYFYDWQIRTPDCLSESTPLVIVPHGYINIAENEKNSVLVYPNPGNGLFTIVGECLEASTHFTLAELGGKIVKQGYLQNGDCIDIRDMSEGIYYLIISVSGQPQVMKLVKTGSK